MKKTTLRSILIPGTCIATVGLIVALAGAAVDDVRWKNIGIGGGGNMVSASISPADPNIVLMGSDVGGFFRSGDGGETWQLKNEALTAPDHHDGYGFYGTFVFDDTDPNIVYAGRMKSHDAGVTWADKIEFRNITVNVNAIDPNTPSIVYGAGYGNVYKSLDAWESSWVPNPSFGPTDPTSCLPEPNGTCPNYLTNIKSLMIDPQPPHQLLACALGLPDTFDPLRSGLYTSDTGGMSWTLLTPPSLPNQNPNGTPRQLCNKLALHKGSRTLYMTLKTTIDDPDSTRHIDIESWIGGVYKSTNWGVNWTPANGTDGANVLLNHGFETEGDPSHPAQSWNYDPSSAPNSVTRELTQSRAVDGTPSNAIKIDLSQVSGNSPRSGIVSECIPVDGSQSYKVSGWAKVSGVTGLSLFVTAVFFNDTCPDVGGIKHYSNGSDESSISSYDPVYDPSKHNGWRKFERIIHPPEGASRVMFTVVSYEATNHGITWVDDVAMEPLHSLPRKPYLEGLSLDYREIVVDPTNPDIAYVGTASGGLNITDGDVGGIYKTTDGGTSWELMTRNHYRDNVMDGRATSPFCGNGFCQGRWENCNSCPEDCGASPCCGNNLCETGESTATCEVDCPLFTDPNRTYYEIDGTNRPGVAGGGGSYAVNSLAIASGPLGHNVLHFGADSYRSIDGGLYWTEVSSNLYNPLPGEAQVKGTWQARGDRNGVFTYSVVTDPRAPSRVYYGDTDNRFSVSYNSGKSFAQEGWDWSTKGFAGDAATAIVLDPASADTIYLGIANGLVQTGNSNAAIGVFNSAHPSGGKWTWSSLGTVGSLPDAGGVGLIRNSSGTFYATVFGLGVYKLLCPTCNWAPVCSTNCNNWDHKPLGWELYPIAQEPTTPTPRIYVGAGVPGTPGGEPADTTGVWESTDAGSNWTRISFHDDLNPALDNNMNNEPVGAILPYGPNTLFAATGPGPRACTLNEMGLCPYWDGDGGLYRAERNGNNWTWTRVIHQPIVSGIDVSPFDNSILYAFVGQVCCSGKQEGQQAGIYKSTNGGRDWHIIPNQGLMNLGVGRLYFSASNPRTLYASTIGDGAFEGTITCADPVREFDCAARINPSADPALSPGSITSGSNSYKNAGSGSIDDFYQTLLEGDLSGKKRLTAVWTIPNGLAGVTYKLRVEGYRNLSANDTFAFSVGTRASGTCTGSESYTSSLTLTDTGDLDVTREGPAGVLTGTATIFCVKVVDMGPGNDLQADTLAVDRLYLLPLEPITAAGESNPPLIGTIFSGSFVATQAHDEQPTQVTEVLREVVVGSQSQLSHAWRFDNVPAGSTYKLHFEGSRPANADGDDFQFYWGTSANGPFTSIGTSARITQPTETPGGTDSSTFSPTNFTGGTLYINIQDTNRANNKKSLDTVSIDHLEVLRVP